MSIYKVLILRIFAVMQADHKYKSVDEFLEVVGRVSFVRDTGFRNQLVQRAKDDGVFPDGWFWKTKEFCDRRGHEVPENLFRSHPDAPQPKAAMRDDAELNI
ncbi:hypothetical protein [Shimia sp.]|uniref:hypothetical protein n=1 Tax=Shimia sp. TaxID=1954381 RepID=UPI003BAD0FF3